MIPNTENLPQTLTDSSRSNEIRSGFLIVASFVALIGLLFAAGNFTLNSNVKEIPIYFNYISGLEKNAPVQYGGHKVGKVSKISYSKEERKILVVASIPKEIELKKDSEAFVDVMGFMGEKLIELSSGSPEAEALLPGEPIQGADPVIMMKLIKDSADLMKEFEKMNQLLQSLAGEVDGVVKENRPALNEITLNLRDSSQNLKEMTEDVKRHPWKLLRKGK